MAVSLSSINALTLSPALCASILQPPKAVRRGPLAWFEKGLGKTRDGYGWLVRRLIRLLTVSMIGFAAVVAATGWLGKTLPTGFVPAEDRGAFFVDVRLPDGAALPRTAAVLTQVETLLMNTPGVANVISVGGYSILSGSVIPNGALLIAVLDPWDERTGPGLNARAILTGLFPELLAIPSATIIPFNPPPIPGLGTTGGFEFILQDTEGRPSTELAGALGGLIVSANGQRELSRVFSTFRANAPQLFVDVNRELAKTKGVDVGDIFQALSANFRLLLHQRFQQVRACLSRLCAGRGRPAGEPERHRQDLCAQPRRRHDPAAGLRQGAADPGAREHRALQSVPLGHGQRQPGRGLRLGPGHRRHGATRQDQPAERLHL